MYWIRLEKGMKITDINYVAEISRIFDLVIWVLCDEIYFEIALRVCENDGCFTNKTEVKIIKYSKWESLFYFY